MLRKLFVLFDDFPAEEESYPNFVARSQIGIDLSMRLQLAEEAQMRFADKGLHLTAQPRSGIVEPFSRRVYVAPLDYIHYTDSNIHWIYWYFDVGSTRF